MTNGHGPSRRMDIPKPKQPTPTGKKVGRPRKAPLSQTTVYDRILDDPKLGDLLLDASLTATQYRRHMSARKEIKARIDQVHPDLIQEPDEDGQWPNMDESEWAPGHGPYVIVQATQRPNEDPVLFRFLARKKPRPEKSVKIKAGRDWDFDAERVEAAPPR